MSVFFNRQTKRFHICLAAVALWVGGAAGVHAACPSTPTADNYSFNGAEVTDKRTGLVWARCSLGQTWNGSTCTGSVNSYSHADALAQAQSMSGWRLPSRRELIGLADKGCNNPAIDSAAFPNTPGSWFWTSAPDIGNNGYAWYVNFSSGYVYYGYRGNYGTSVRLVRASK
jgi:hypothetical protein